MTDSIDLQGTIEEDKTKPWGACNNPRPLTSPTVNYTAGGLNMSLTRKRKTPQGFGAATAVDRHYLKIARWALQNELIKKAIEHPELCREATATYAFAVWYCHKNNKVSFAEHEMTSRYKQIFKLLDAMESVLGHRLDEVA